VRLSIGDHHRVVDTDGGPGALTINGLEPDRAHDISVDGHLRSTVRTLTPPPGPELFRFATISDLHLGETSFGYFGTMRERPAPLVPYSVRATRAALAELRAWGAELVVVKGDCTNDGRVEEWATFGSLLADAGLPFAALPGNHDARPVERDPTVTGHLRQAINGGLVKRLLTGPPAPKGRAVTPAEGLRSVGTEPPSPTLVHDVDGLRIILVDTTQAGRHLGTLTDAIDDIADAAADARRDGRAVFVAGHHYPMPWSVPYFWPPGVPSRDVGSLFRRLSAANPAAFYTAGHTHRHRRYDRAGVCCTEVGSPKDYPGTWAGYIVYESGLTQLVWRVASPDVLVWTERSRRAALGLWGRWSPGRLDHRCFHYRWPA
jgi:predicted phosphodiesterase